MNIVALIAAKEHSTRVPEKNLREFHAGKSLLEIKIEQCISSQAFSQVYVSSDSQKVKRICDRLGASFLLRNERLCRDETPWSEVLEGILMDMPISDEDLVAWCPVTSPLFGRFDELVAVLNASTSHDSIITVTPTSHYYLSPDYIPLNHQWGAWHSYSQGMRPIYHLNLACMISAKKVMIRNQYLIGNKPIFYNIGQFEGLDIDTMEEFDVARLIYPRVIHGKR